MKTILLAAVAVITLNLTSVAHAAEKPAPPSVKAGIEKCTVTTPQGEFAQVRIEFDAPVGWTLLATMRDGRIRVDDTIGLIEPGGWLEVKDGKLRGSFRRYIPGSSGGISDLSEEMRKIPGITSIMGTLLSMHQFEIDGTVNGDAIVGVCRVPTAVATAERSVGTISGAITREAALSKNNALPAGVSWDSFLGSAGMGGAAMPTAAVLLSPDRARFAWRSEELVGNGLSPLTRAMQTFADAVRLRTSSGSFSPVLGDGKVFCYMRVPRPGAFGANHPTAPNYEAAAKQLGLEKVPLYVQEKSFGQADEVVVAMDAVTGKTVWRAVIEIGVPNVQFHKERNSDRTSAYADGKLFVPGRADYLYAFDAKTGKPLWQAPCIGAAVGIVATPEVVVVPAWDKVGRQWRGLDPQTGATLWTMDGKAETWSPSRWVHGGKTYIVAVVNMETGYQMPAKEELVCLDPTTGTPLWKVPVPELFSHAGVTVVGDVLMGYFNLADPAMKNAEGANEDGSMKSLGKLAARAYRLTAKGPEQAWEYAGVGHPYSVPVVATEKYAFVCSSGEILFAGKGKLKAAVIELATGKVTDEVSIPDADGGRYLPCNGGYVQSLGNMVYTRIDGTHGDNQFAFWTVSAAGKVTAKTPWAPPQYGGRTQTTSYHHPIMYALADGRMFLRQYDGIYCYDVRAGAGALAVQAALRDVTGDQAIAAKLCELTGKGDAATRVEAGIALAQRIVAATGETATVAMAEALAAVAGQGDAAADDLIARALTVCGDKALPGLLALTKSPQASARLLAMDVAGRLGQIKDPRIVEILEAGLRDADVNVVRMAIQATDTQHSAILGKALTPGNATQRDALLMFVASRRFPQATEAATRALAQWPVDPLITTAFTQILNRTEVPAAQPGAFAYLYRTMAEEKKNVFLGEVVTKNPHQATWSRALEELVERKAFDVLGPVIEASTGRRQGALLYPLCLAAKTPEAKAFAVAQMKKKLEAKANPDELNINALPALGADAGPLLPLLKALNSRNPSIVEAIRQIEAKVAEGKK